jgi:hypothetical protein
MLDTFVNQAAGLQGLADPAAPRLILIASHGQQQGELPLLWSLCSAWEALGLSVLVLDGLACETPQNPGLLQLLDDPHSRFDHADSPLSWTVVSAQQGLSRLSAQTHPEATLGTLFGNYAVVLIYASAQATSKIFKNNAGAPLLLLTPHSTSSVSAYQALKQLRQQAQLRPTIANIAISSKPRPGVPAYSSFQNLQNCAMTFLGYRLDAATIRVTADDTSAQNDIRSLALKLLESSLPLLRSRLTEIH